MFKKPIPTDIKSKANLLDANSLQGVAGDELAGSLARNTEVVNLIGTQTNELGTSSVQQEMEQAKGDFVQGLQTTEPVDRFEHGDWRGPLVNYLKDPSQTRDRKIR